MLFRAIRHFSQEREAIQERKRLQYKNQLSNKQTKVVPETILCMYSFWHCSTAAESPKQVQLVQLSISIFEKKTAKHLIILHVCWKTNKILGFKSLN